MSIYKLADSMLEITTVHHEIYSFNILDFNFVSFELHDYSRSPYCISINMPGLYTSREMTEEEYTRVKTEVFKKYELLKIEWIYIQNKIIPLKSIKGVCFSRRGYSALVLNSTLQHWPMEISRKQYEYLLKDLGERHG